MDIFYTDSYEGGRQSSRELLALVLERYFGLTDPEILEMEGGKPYVAGGPEFSVSHSGKYWAVLIDDNQCGLDIQVPRRNTDLVAVAKRIFSEEETDLVRMQGEDAFFRLWTRREALVKCAGNSVFKSDAPKLLIPLSEDALKVFYDGEYRAVFDLDLPVELYGSICITVDSGWETRREVPRMRRLDI